MKRLDDTQSPAGLENWKLICDLLDSSAEEYADRVLFKDSSGRSLSYAESRELVDDLARGLVLDGFAAGDKVGLLGERNSSDWCISYLAILRIGAVVVPLEPALKSEEIAVMLGDCEASGIISSGRTIEMLKKMKADLKSLERIVSLDRSGSFGVPSVADLTAKGHGQVIKFPQVDPDSLAVLIYTSGTTGRPKGVMLSNTNIVSDIKAVHSRLRFSSDDVFLSILPLHHTFECTCGFLTPVSTGSRIAFARSYKSGELLEDMRNNKVTIMCGVPLLYEKMYLAFRRKVAKGPVLKRVMFRLMYSISSYGLKRWSRWGKTLFRAMRRKAGLDSVRMLVSGSAALPHEVGHFFNAIGIDLVQGYGLSETSPVLSVSPVAFNKIESVGPFLEGIEARIDNPDDHGAGEIVVSGPMVMLGYFRNEAATAAVVRQRWFFTGDIGWIDVDGYLHITGRSKNVIVSAAGKNIYPEEIETMLNGSPYILESLVLGRKVPNSNIEEVTAVVVPDKDFIMQANTTGDLQDNRSVEEIIREEVGLVCSRLADFKRIKKYYVRDEEIPKTSTRKIRRCMEIDDSGNLVEMRKV